MFLNSYEPVKYHDVAAMCVDQQQMKLLRRRYLPIRLDRHLCLKDAEARNQFHRRAAEIRKSQATYILKCH